MKTLRSLVHPALIGLAVATFVAMSMALADSCPNCGGDLTDDGRCPYCQPKPNEGTSE